MNTNQNFSKRSVFTIFALLAALWLPSVSMAQGNSVNQISDRGVGFGESDPTLGQVTDAVAFTQAPRNRAIHARAGFSETDPSVQRFQDGIGFWLASDNPVSNEIIGFAETDAATEVNWPVADSSHYSSKSVSVEVAASH